MSALAAIRVFRRLTTTRLRRGRLRWVALALLLLPVLGTAGLAIGGAWGPDLFTNILEIHLRFLVLFLPALATSQVVAEEIEGKTFTFIFARPSPRWAMPVGKYLAAVVPLVVGFVLSVSLSYVIAMLRPPATLQDFTGHLGTLARSLATVSLGVLVFGALSALLGSWLTRHPFIAVMGYLLLVEGLLASLPLIINVVAMSWHLRNIAGITMAPGTDFIFAEAHLAPALSALVVVGVTAAALVGASLSVASAEYRTDR